MPSVQVAAGGGVPQAVEVRSEALEPPVSKMARMRVFCPAVKRFIQASSE
jgi:hypothetical protein